MSRHVGYRKSIKDVKEARPALLSCPAIVRNNVIVLPLVLALALIEYCST